MPVPAALAGIGAFLAENPWAAAIIANIGMNIGGSIFGQTSPYEQAVQQQAQIGKSLIPQLQRQAAGLPTAASQAIMRQVRQNTTAAQQSYAAGATARGGGGTPVAAQQSRFRAAETQTLGNVLGQQQMQAQQQLASLYGTGLQMQGTLEQQEAAAQQQVMRTLMRFLQRYRENPDDPMYKEMYESVVKPKLGFASQFGYDTNFTLGR